MTMVSKENLQKVTSRVERGLEEYSCMRGMRGMRGRKGFTERSVEVEGDGDR